MGINNESDSQVFGRRHWLSIASTAAGLLSPFLWASGGEFSAVLFIGVLAEVLALWSWVYPQVECSPEWIRINRGPLRKALQFPVGSFESCALERGTLGLVGNGRKVMVPLRNWSEKERSRLLVFLSGMGIKADYLAVFHDPDRSRELWLWKGRIAVLVLAGLLFLFWHLRTA